MPVVRLLEDLLLVGDFDGRRSTARRSWPGETGREGTRGRRAHANGAIEALAKGPALRHLITHLDTPDEAQFDAVQRAVRRARRTDRQAARPKR